METSEPAEEHERSSWGKIVSVSALLTLLITVFLLAFALPNINAGPRDLPVAIVGAEETTRAWSPAKRYGHNQNTSRAGD